MNRDVGGFRLPEDWKTDWRLKGLLAVLALLAGACALILEALAQT